MADVYINSRFVGTVDDINLFVENIKDERRKGSLAEDVNVYTDIENNEVHVNCDGGRARRPLIIIKEGKSLLTERHLKQLKDGEITWADLVRQGVVEYLDAGEEENALVAYDETQLTEKHTHMEITPGSISGIATALVPFGNFNQSSRLIIGSKNQKQSLGFYAANYHIRLDMDTNLLHYPQFPLVKTKLHDVTNYDEHPAGQNMVVAIMCFDGYNMEDGVILNKSSVERGLARSTYFRPVSAEELRYSGGLIDEVSIPDKEVKGYRSEADYKFLEGDGIIYPEAKVCDGDVIIGRTSPPRFLSSLDEYNLSAAIRRESSVSLKHGEKGVADFVVITENEEGNKLVQVRLREERIPEIGDKFTSRHGQKGVTGILVPVQDIPFSANGITPDLIFTPHGISSRMTISHLLELIGGKVGALSGRFVDGTLFEAESELNMRAELLNLGFKEDGTETFYDGRTGKQMLAKIYVGNMYYLRLRHLVANKMQSRARGPIQLLTRQPTEGKAKEGGLRLGEMEKDVFIAHGASLLLKERFDSDKTNLPVCEKCGLVAVEDQYKNRKYCLMCGEDVNINYVEMSYAFKLLLDEIRSLGIYPKLNLENKY
ncbi:DNA-directed RNA polymerase subunit B [Candidatus Woesearchaeota archaeon]|jgi:DNA-directed RNA polymerase subunit B'|nr:DNA-directed RNA polymerase subunit B [Candidatus Woesearchaeota archaeon]MBT4110732.1 DNA-directed RNA polymerase subunit B [Candidatus Woesearchaeota archaeon]MBT4336328.1 DNA-directed RNA polymerase subunit B [Candidatus Woesearchaeota archaeon]MBT4469311.1 DNA-directed RNA polymerase subunit B [Candidatus Woesearchaeota archaeon]MBT6743866.1 DNA-directed RNA polymerase subunit B [Candidatus Woesearchaeota archaeon]